MGDLHPGTALSDPLPYFVLNKLLVYTPEFFTEVEPWVTDGTPQGTRLLKNFNPNGSSYLTYLLTANGWAYFGIDDGEHGNELWRTDGTPENTTLVADINPGPEGSYPATMIHQGDWLYFVATINNYPALWRTDGTTANTQRIGAVNLAKPGLGMLNSQVFFLGYDPDTGAINLWHTTPDGGDVENLNVIICQDNCPYYDWPSFYNLNGKLYFVNNNRLWVSDGTTSGISVVKILADPEFRPWLFKKLGNKLYLTAGDGTGKKAIWVSDGTEAGTHLVASQAGQQAFSDPAYLTISGGKLYFSASDPVHGNELWALDDSGEAYLFKDLVPGIKSGTPIFLTDINGTLYFAGGDSDCVFGANLWRSQGSADDTQIVTDINPKGSDRVTYLTAWNGRLAFSAGDGVHGEELWFSDGTPAGPAMILDQNTYPAGGFVKPGKMFKNQFYFTNTDDGGSLWRTNGTPQGTELFYPDINASLDSFSLITKYYDGPAELNGILYFPAWDDKRGTQLWRTDGTPGGTYPVTNQNPDTGGISIGDIISADGYIWFTGIQSSGFGQPNINFYRTDGTLTGTTQIDNLVPNGMAVLNNRGILKVGAYYYRTVSNGSIEFFDDALGTEDTFVFFWVQISGDRLFFSHDGPLYMTDGNSVTVIKDQAEVEINRAAYLTNLNGDIYFTEYANHETWIYKLPAGSDKAQPVKRISPSGDAMLLTPVGNKVVFKVGVEYFPGELWVTDGTENGTHRICESCDLQVGDFMEASQGLAFFDGIDTTHGKELWVTDGTESGTTLFMDINPGTASSNPSYLYAMGDTLFFNADDGLHGMEPWVVPSYRKVFLPLVRR
ncbi:MAG: hypothetical protein HY835_02845 [Anaerolineae bacterium]|nr:hypothetical protein [Anaerolineae bacterium]